MHGWRRILRERRFDHFTYSQDNSGQRGNRLRTKDPGFARGFGFFTNTGRVVYLGDESFEESHATLIQLSASSN